MTCNDSNRPPRRWFRRVVWLGILANLALAIPTLLAPERMIAMASLPPATPLLWPRSRRCC